MKNIYKNHKDYLVNLLHYVKEFKLISLQTKDSLKDILNYCEQKFNKNSEADNTCVCKIQSLFEKFDYISKYLDITFDFYNDLGGSNNAKS